MGALEEALASLYGKGGPAGGAVAMSDDGGADYSFLNDLGKTKKKKRGLFGGNLLQDVLDVVSLPLAATTAVAEETVGQGARALGNMVYGAPQDAGFSLERIGRRTIDPESQIHGADLIEGNAEKGLDVGMFGEQGTYSKWKPPTAAKIAMGFGLDVAMDPLSYLMPAGKVHGAAEAAGHITEAAGLQIGEKLGLPGGKLSGEMVQQILKGEKTIDQIVKVPAETAMEIEEIRKAAQAAVHAARRGGASALTAEQLDRFGKFKNMEGIERVLDKGMNLDFGRFGKIRLTSGEGVVAQASVIRHKMQMGLGDFLLGTESKGLTRLGKLSGNPELASLARSGPAARDVSESGLSMMDATVLKRLRSTTRNIASTAAKDAHKASFAAIKGHTAEQIQAAHDVLDSGIESADEAVNALAGKLSEAFEKHGKQLVDAGVLTEDELIKNGRYFPSPITKDAREALVAAGLHPAEGGVFNNVKGFVEGKRRLFDPTTGEAGIGHDTETTVRLKAPTKLKNRLEAEQWASKEVAKKLKAQSEIEGDAGELARDFIGKHPEVIPMLEKGEYPLFMEGREALVAQGNAIGRRVAQARAGQKLFEQGYGTISPKAAKGFVDYGHTPEEVANMLALGGKASHKAMDRDVLSRLLKQRADKLEARLPRETPPEAPLAGGGPVPPTGPTHPFPGSEAAGEARLAADPAAAGNRPVDATLHPDAPASDFDHIEAPPKDGGPQGWSGENALPTMPQDVVGPGMIEDVAPQIVEVPVDRVVGYQGRIDPARVDDIARNGENAASEASAIKVVDAGNGNWILEDGNHRVAAAMQNGEPTFQATLTGRVTDDALSSNIATRLAPKDKPPALAEVVAKAHASSATVENIDAAFAPHGWTVKGDMPATARRIVVTGGRDEVHPGATRLLIRKLKELYGDEITIVHGDARGVDRTFAKVAREEGVAVEAHPADWNKLGKRAGFVRNQAMADSGVDMAVVMPGGKGTAHMAGVVRKKGIPTIELGPGRAAEAGAPGSNAEQALAAVHTELTTQQITQNMNAVEATMDDARALFASRAAEAGKPQSVLKITEHENALRAIIQKLQLDEPSSFGYRDPLEEIPIPGFNPTGTVGTSSGPQKIRAMEDLLKKQIADFEAHPDVYAAKTRARVEGKVAEDAQKAKVGAELDDTTLTPERRRPWTYEEKQAHKDTYSAVKELGVERGKALQDVKEAERAVAKARRTPDRIVRQTTERADTRLRLARDERQQLSEGLAAKHAEDVQDAARNAEIQAHESPIGAAGEMEGENLPRWADKNTMSQEGELTGDERRLFETKMRQWQERNNMPIEHTETTDYLRERAQGAGTRSEGTRQYLQSDKAVTDEVTQRIAALDDEIDFLERTVSFGPEHPVTQLDIAEARLEARKANLQRVTNDLEAQKRGLPKDRTFSDEVIPAHEEPTEGSAYEAVIKKMHETIAENNAKAVEPHLESREAWVHGDTPFTNAEGDVIKEGTLAGPWNERVDPEVMARRVEVIKERWRTLGATVNDHSQLRDAFAAYKGGLDKAIPQSVERDMQALAHTQIDQVGQLAQSEAHVASVADDIIADADAVRGVADSVVPEQVQVNFDKRAMEASLWQQASEQGRAAGENARAEIANMRLVADQLANDADMYHAYSEHWLNEWNSITTERAMHSAVNSLLVQGSVDWLAHTALQRGILTPKGVAEALLYTERIATPEGQARFAASWRKALHWMRVWQITSPGFHVRNLFGGVFNNALAGVNVEAYVRFSRLWRKARAAENGGAALTERELLRWNNITSVMSPGQIASEGLGNPASRIMGEAAISKTPWGQLGTHGAAPRISEAAGSQVEFFLRGSLMDDVIEKGGSLDDAVEAMNKYHFDYHDMSHDEEWLKANAIPFLTWTRHNVPLQLQMMVQNPRPYARFAHFKRNVEAQSTADAVVPGYFADINAVRLPWGKGGGHNYYVPDLPFRDLGLITEPIQQIVGGEGDLGDRVLGGLGEPISSTTPLISGPVEWMLGKQFFKGIPLRNDRAIKLHDLHIPEWLATPLRMTPLVKRGKNGQSYITERDFYIFEKMLPILGRARRLGGSSETKQRDKMMSRMISFWAGTQIRTNTEEDQGIANYISTIETKRRKTIDNGLSK